MDCCEDTTKSLSPFINANEDIVLECNRCKATIEIIQVVVPA